MHSETGPEILNIEYHKKRLILKALNRERFHSDSARALGIHPISVHRYIRRFRIKISSTGKYFIEQKA
jgi:transcriptional regulator with GAF, ATPase, and Fis domain